MHWYLSTIENLSVVSKIEYVQGVVGVSSRQYRCMESKPIRRKHPSISSPCTKFVGLSRWYKRLVSWFIVQQAELLEKS